MTYSANETSQQGGRPVEIYRFVLGGETFEYTSNESAVVVDSLTYHPEAIRRGRITQGDEARSAAIEVTVPGENEFATKYVANAPGQMALLTIRRFHRGDAEVKLIFDGVVESISFTEDLILARIHAAPAPAATSRQVPLYTFAGSCQNVLFDDRCKVDPNDPEFHHVGGVTLVAGNEITVNGASGFPDGSFTGGYVETLDGDARLVLEHTGDVLKLLLPFPLDPTGTNVTVFVGCNHLAGGDCRNKFFTDEDTESNLLNFHGFPFVPNKNPFETGL